MKNEMLPSDKPCGGVEVWENHNYLFGYMFCGMARQLVGLIVPVPQPVMARGLRGCFPVRANVMECNGRACLDVLVQGICFFDFS